MILDARTDYEAMLYNAYDIESGLLLTRIVRVDTATGEALWFAQDGKIVPYPGKVRVEEK